MESSKINAYESTEQKGRMVGWKDCKHAQLTALQDMRICREDENDLYNTWSCNISRHWVGAHRCRRPHAQSGEACVPHRRAPPSTKGLPQLAPASSAEESAEALQHGEYYTQNAQRYTSTCAAPRVTSGNGHLHKKALEPRGLGRRAGTTGPPVTCAVWRER